MRTDGVFDILARDHHEVGELVNDDDDERHLIGMISVLVGKLALLNHLVVEADVLGTDAFEDLESALHLGNSPLKGARSLFGLGDWRNEEMRDAVVKRHFDALRVNENHADLGRRRTHEYGHDHGVEAHDLPEPVVPAMSKCGILARSTQTFSPSTSSPMAT